MWKVLHPLDACVSVYRWSSWTGTLRRWVCSRATPSSSPSGPAPTMTRRWWTWRRSFAPWRPWASMTSERCSITTTPDRTRWRRSNWTRLFSWSSRNRTEPCWRSRRKNYSPGISAASGSAARGDRSRSWSKICDENFNRNSTLYHLRRDRGPC